MVAVSGLLLVFSGGTVSLALIVFFFGGALFITYPAAFSSIADGTAHQHKGAVFGSLFGFQLLGGVITSYIGGHMADLYGIHTPFLLITFLSAAALLYIMVRKDLFSSEK